MFSIIAAILAAFGNMSFGASEPPISESLGGEGTVIMRGADAFSLPARNATPEHRRSFVIGNSLFKENWVSTPASVKTRQGLGPIFNAQSCSTCHFKDGRGQPPTSPGESFSSMLIRWSVPGKGPHGGPLDVPGYGDQLQHRAILGVRPKGDVKVSYEEIPGKYPDGTAYVLLKPKYTFEKLAFGALPENVMISPRVAPQVIGMGLLEAIRESDLLANTKTVGVSGRPNWVWDVTEKRRRIGRLGWKANQPSVSQQNAGAFLGDMGITSKVFPKQNCPTDAKDCLESPALSGFELDERDRVHMDTYMRLIAVPAKRPSDPRGLSLFRVARCQSCHTESYTTGKFQGFPELSHQKIHPFTDLLLHDMGEGLADGRPDFEADGNEWRTPPLWGIGLVKEVNGHTRFLHDGRARNLEEAILWHGGEAESSRIAFMEFSREERDLLIRFLESL